MRAIFRRNTSPGPPPSSPRSSLGDRDPVIGFGIPNTVERLKKGQGFRFRERDRVKMIAPPDFAHKTGYIVESHDLDNDKGLMEIELDHPLTDGQGYTTLTDPTSQRQRLTVKNPNAQLRPHKYMKCQSQHFATSIRAEALIQMSYIATYILGFEIVSVLFAIKSGASQWNHSELFIVYALCSSISIGLGFFVVLILSFIGISIKRISGQNNLWQNGDIHDECTSYHWLKSTHWKPWWLCGRDDVSCIEYICHHSAKAMIVFIASFMLSIVIYISDQVEWYLVIICLLFVATPSLLALHVIKNREMMSF